MSVDYYKILEVDRNASQDEIKKSYRRLSMMHHPDKNDGSAESAEKFKELSNAYETLSDPEKKQQYDTYGQSNSRFQGHGFNMEDIFSQFGDIFSGFKQQRVRKGSDVTIKVTVSLNDILFGCDRKVRYQRQDKCHTCEGKGGKDTKVCTSCNGSGQKITIQNTPFGKIQQTILCNECSGSGKTIANKCKSCNGNGSVSKEETVDIKIPAGVYDGIQLTMQGNGNYIKDGTHGDLHIQVQEIADDKFKRQNSDLHCDEWISISDAVLGTNIIIDTPLGRIPLNIIPGCESGTTFTFKGKGVPTLSNDGRNHGNGSLYVKINIRIPKMINNTQKELFEKLRTV